MPNPSMPDDELIVESRHYQVLGALTLLKDFQVPTAIKNRAGRQSGSEPSTEALEDPICIGRAS